MAITKMTNYDAVITQPAKRISELDILRGFAVLGIFWVNLIVFGLPGDVYSQPMLFHNGHTANIVAWAFNNIFIEGTMRGLFSMLFGASAMIFLDEARQQHQGIDVADRFYRRNLLLIAFGMIHAYLLLWPYDVLYVYGLLGMFLFPLRKMPAWVFLVIGCLLLAIADVSVLPDRDYNNDGDAYIAAEEVEITPDEQQQRLQLLPAINEEVQFRRSGYLAQFNRQISTVIYQQSKSIYTTNIFDMGGMMLVGIALFKLGILTGARSSRFYWLLALVSYSIGITSRSIPVYNIITQQQLNWGLPLFDGLEYSFARLPVALGHLSIIMLLSRQHSFNWLTRLLTPVGRMALTSYLLQTCIAIFIFYGFGLGLFGAFERYQLVYICIAVWLLLISSSQIWLHYFYQGPLEWLWRSLIYGKAQPFRK